MALHIPYRPLPAGVEVVPLGAEHLDAAAGLFATAVGAVRDRIPTLPDAAADPELARTRLDIALASGPGFAAVGDGRVLGYMTSLGIPGLRGTGTAGYCPVWSHAAAGPDRAAIYLALYERLAACWLLRGWTVQCVTLLPDDAEIEELLGWLGFGRFSLDMVMGLPGAHAATAGAEPYAVTRATPDDLDELRPLVADHYSYYGRSPVFLSIDELDGDPARRLSSPDESVWIARAGGHVAGFFFLSPPATGSSPLVRDPKTIYIDGAWVAPEERRGGAGRAILDAVSRWAPERGFERIAVDCETANPLAVRFWLRFFTPIGFSFERHVDERLVQERRVDERRVEGAVR